MQTNEQKISELVEPITDYMQNCGLELKTQQQITEQIRFALSKMANWKDDVIINIQQKLSFLRDLYNAEHDTEMALKVYKFEQLDCYNTGAALAIVAAENGDQATKLMEDARKGGMQDFYGYNICGLDFEAFDTLNPTEIPCLQTTLTKPTIIEIVEYNEG